MHSITVTQFKDDDDDVITTAETPWLNGRHTIFGQVTEGYDVVEAMSKVATGGQDKPADEIVIERIDIVE